MKKLYGIALFLLFLSPAHSTVLIRRLGGGGSPYNLGDSDGSNNLSAQETNADESYWSSTVFTTTDAGTVGNGCVKGGGIPGAVNLKLHIITNASPHTIVCTSDAISMPEGSTDYNCEDMSDNSCGTLSATTDYGIAVTVNGSINLYWTNSGAGDWDTGVDTTGSYATPPTTFNNFNTTAGDLNFTHPLAAYVVINP